MECSIADCTRPPYGRGWCKYHWQRWSRTGDPLGSRRHIPRRCRVEGCERTERGRTEICELHRLRLARTGEVGVAGVLVAPAGSAERWLIESLTARPTDDCVIWPFALTAKGYGRVSFGGRTRPAHAAVLERVVGMPPEGHEARHLCGVRSCVNPRHLRWSTHQENESDKRLHGTLLCGERNPAARLTPEQVGMIRAFPHSARVLAVALGVTRYTIQNVRRGKTWVS